MHIFDNFLQFCMLSSLGLSVALLSYFGKDLRKFFRTTFSNKRSYRKKKSKPLFNIILTFIVGLSAGWVIFDIIQRNHLFDNIFMLSIFMGIVGIVMIIVDRVIRKDKIKDEAKLEESHALIIGTSEIFATLPGIFHLAPAIISGRLLGMNNSSAARYSFITSIPFLLGTFFVTLFAVDGGIDYFASNCIALIISNIITFILGFFAIKLILKILAKPKTLQWFGYSRVVISLIIAIVALII